MTSWFLKRGYPESVVKTETGKIKFKQRLVGKREAITKWVPLLFTYLSLLKAAGRILLKYLNLLCMDKEVKRVYFNADISLENLTKTE